MVFLTGLLSVLNIANINAFMSRLENSIKQILSPQQVTTMEVGSLFFTSWVISHHDVLLMVSFEKDFGAKLKMLKAKVIEFC